MRRAQFKTVNPVLPARNVSAAIRYYTDKLGFELRFQDPPAAPTYAVVGRDNVELHLQWQDATDFRDNGDTLQLRFIIDDVDALFAEYQPQAVFHARTTLRDTPWGTREFAFFDPDGNGLTFYRAL